MWAKQAICDSDGPALSHCGQNMSAELIGILGVGAALGRLMLTLQSRADKRMDRIESRLSERLGRIEDKADRRWDALQAELRSLFRPEPAPASSSGD